MYPRLAHVRIELVETQKMGKKEIGHLFLFSPVANAAGEFPSRSNSIASFSRESFASLLKHNPVGLIERLQKQDMSAWTAVRDFTIVPYLAKTKYGQMAKKKNVDIDEIYDYVQVEMTQGGKLALLRDVTQIEDIIKQYTRKYVQALYVERKKKIADSTMDEDGWAGWEKDNLYFKHLKDLRSMDMELDVRKCVRELWKKNPLRAYVLVLRIKNGLSARDIRSFCNLSSEGYVNTLFKRAKGDVRKTYVSQQKKRSHKTQE